MEASNGVSNGHHHHNGSIRRISNAIKHQLAQLEGHPTKMMDDTTKPTAVHPPNEEKKTEGEGLQMKRQVSLLSGIAIVVGSMIGSGIFITPGGVLKRAGSVGLSFIVWTVCGLLAIFGSLSYAELGTLIPKSGGEYAYFLDGFGTLHRFWGPLLAFLYSWLLILLIKPTSIAVSCLSAAKYTTGPILSALDKHPSVDEELLLRKLLALFILGFIICMNCYSVKGTLWICKICTVAKLSALAILIGIGIYQLAMGQTQYLALGFEGSSTDAGLIAVAFYGGLYSYNGWNNLNFITEELKNPYVNLPRVLLIGIPLVMACYLSVNIAYLTVLSPQEMISSSAVAVDVGNAFLGPVSFIIPVTVVMSILGSVMTSGFVGGRLCFATAREGHMVEVLSYVHVENLTPMPALIFMGAISIIMILAQDVAALVDLFSFANWIFYVLAMVLIVVLRRTRPDANRPYRVFLLFPIIMGVIGCYLVIAPIVYNPVVQYLYVLVVFIIGFLVYIPFVYFKYSIPCFTRVTRVIQLILNIAPSAKYDENKGSKE